ncbi:sulfite exporter TauE/SafE family protein [Pseudorhodoferax soli]|uniref:Probable membrane transporter protein n=1 Tax=Pseudorhodoferax soli TaxID=545864 RepID=A0A368XNT8_9BURK|nr:sulfite exporter TauE/SafE family protein [Pseudorhodoferax soli]RCW68678.1 sulfite exporter TauE/SafE [Pseudorhodoferax soli]
MAALFAQGGLAAHLTFVFFVAASVYVQTLTGFALSLLLLGFVGLTNLFPLPDAVNAVSFIVVMNAATFLHRRRPLRFEPAMKTAVLFNVVGSFIGMGVLVLLAAHAFHLLRTLLGVIVIGCALLLWRMAKPHETTSPPRVFAFVGLLSGVLGGMFSAAGPPLVYVVYRQPWPLERIQESLIFSFGIGALLRLVVLGLSGRVGAQSLLLAAEAIPVVLLVTTVTANRKLPVSRETLRHIVCALLICTGVGMLV